MQKLIEGAHKFRREEFGRYKQLFRRLSLHGQTPHTLFITCADSRVLAELITQSQPGDLFVVKNPGNIVPPSDPQATVNSTGAAVEFAVERLGVTDIVVCGHSQCGAIAALMSRPDNLHQMPNLQRWIQLAEPVRDFVSLHYTHLSPPEQLRAAEEENVLFSLEQLRSYPCVATRLHQGSLRLHGWFFKIATAELFAYDPDLKQFAPIVLSAETEEEPPDQPTSSSLDTMESARA